jgi:hypothetical protein
MTTEWQLEIWIELHSLLFLQVDKASLTSWHENAFLWDNSYNGGVARGMLESDPHLVGYLRNSSLDICAVNMRYRYFHIEVKKP